MHSVYNVTIIVNNVRYKESREHGLRDPSNWRRVTLYPQNLALTSPTSGGSSVGTVRSRTQAMEFTFFLMYKLANLILESPMDTKVETKRT
jgi:hypothetical protein